MKQYIPTNEGVYSTTYTVAPGWDIPVYEVMIAGRDYDGVEYAANRMWSSGKSGEYGKGIANTSDDPKRVERSGKHGEMAFAKIYGLPFDYSYRKGGDEYDFRWDGVTIDVKTSVSLPPQRHALITAYRNGYDIPLKCDVYVAAYVAHDDVEKREAKVVLMGYMTAERVAFSLPRKGKGGMHSNYVMEYICLSRMAGLASNVQLIAQQKENENGKAA